MTFHKKVGTIIIGEEIMKLLSIFLCKVATRLAKFMRRDGSVIGGFVALKISPNVLSKIKLPKYVIGVTGSSGKGSTTELVARILSENGFKVIYNKNGSNVTSAIASLILNNSTWNGKLKGDVLLMELDERHSGNSLKFFDLSHLVITNITRDQPPRNAHPEFIQRVIKNIIKDSTHIIINVDDPLVNALSIDHKGKLSTYGIDKNNYSTKSSLNNLDGSYCPKCNTKLKYAYYNYGHIGSYSCPKCKWGRSKPDYLAHNINVVKGTIFLNKQRCNLPSNFLYSVYFVTASYALASELGLSSDSILNVINDESFKPKRLNIYNFDNRLWQMLASKNENNLSYKQSLDFIINEPGKKTVILGFDNSSRRYSENDISWIWDIDFEDLTHKSIDKIVLVGRFKYDMLTRMEYAGIDRSKILLIENLADDLLPVLRSKTKGNIYSCVCFDKEIELKSILKKDGEHNA